MKKATIYTRTGDNGTTSLIGGARVAKDHPRVEAYGTLDELNAQLGLLAIAIANHPQKETVERIEKNIITICSILATDTCEPQAIAAGEIESIEKEIDNIDILLPPLRCFLLPSGVYASAQANLCRAVCRRAERRIVSLSSNCVIESSILTYINRISDYLFTLSRLLDSETEKKQEKCCK